MNKTTENIFKYCPELLIVAIGAVLGIYISKWRNENKEKIINNIINELENSQEGLKKINQI